MINYLGVWEVAKGRVGKGDAWGGKRELERYMGEICNN